MRRNKHYFGVFPVDYSAKLGAIKRVAKKLCKGCTGFFS